MSVFHLFQSKLAGLKYTTMGTTMAGTPTATVLPAANASYVDNAANVTVPDCALAYPIHTAMEIPVDTVVPRIIPSADIRRQNNVHPIGMMHTLTMIPMHVVMNDTSKFAWPNPIASTIAHTLNTTTAACVTITNRFPVACGLMYAL